MATSEPNRVKMSESNPVNAVRRGRPKSLEDLAEQSDRINKLYEELQKRDSQRAMRLMRDQYGFDRGMELMDNVSARENRKKKADRTFNRYFSNALSYALRYGQLGNRTFSGPTGRIKVPRGEYARR